MIILSGDSKLLCCAFKVINFKLTTCIQSSCDNSRDYLQVTGTLLCGDSPAVGVRVKLIDDDFGKHIRRQQKANLAILTNVLRFPHYFNNSLNEKKRVRWTNK